MSIKTCKTAVRASALLAAVALSGGVFADGTGGNGGNFYSFEDATSTDGLRGGAVVAGTFAADVDSTVKRPLGDTALTSAKVYEIAGTAVYTNDSAVTTGSSQVDLMFRVESTDELENISDPTVQVALAVGTNLWNGAVEDNKAKLMLWCTPNGVNGPAWLELKTVTTCTWVRATLVLDYGNKRCRVSIDGDPVVVDGAVESSWYAFANNGNQNYLKSLTMVGSTLIDELVVTNASLEAYVTPGTETATVEAGDTGVAVSYEYMNEWGVTKAQVEANQPLNASSGMSVADKFKAGLDPNSATKFELKTMSMTADSATITFPGANAASSYTVKVLDASKKDVGATVTSREQTGTGEKLNTQTVTIPSANRNELLYFQVVTE